MPITRPKFRHSWIALVAFVGALLASGGASSVTATVSPPQKQPIYLRNARLLI